ncbi:ADP-ribosylglycohydrolase family protein [candidate division BRC1 bacterium HGW-BRC1-1]|jgi:ADP-ribosylglycohydrolase|nr:MAG: ADP-ribosylglycohydrolase family protein [candidate division BRC1 bacterium HGW-BRC1-1]
MDSTLDLLDLLRTERTQLLEETGSDANIGEALEKILAQHPTASPERDAAFEALYLSVDPIVAAADADVSREPNDLDAILAAAPANLPALGAVATGDNLADRMLGAWQGRIAGCILGKPVEGFSKEEIDQVLASVGETTITDFVPEPTVIPRWAELKDDVKMGCLRGNIRRAEFDDDINYTVLSLLVMESKGRDFTPVDVMWAWLKLLPAGQTYTAERVAYRNFLNNVLPPESACVRNPYREWIGAQIRTDFFGYANPGNPRAAAAMAWRDACISHRKNGIYGAMFSAAANAAAFASTDIEQAVREGIAVLPEQSRLAIALNEVIAWWKEDGTDWPRCHARILKRHDGMSWVHTINNAAITVMALLFGGGDLGRTISIAVHAGLDTDCNGATAGSIVGALRGARALPAKWIAPFNDTVECSLASYGTNKITDLATRSVKIARQGGAA